MKKYLSHEEKTNDLHYHMFIKKKCDRTITARGCTYGRSQREYLAKSDSISLTVLLEAMMISCTIDVKESRGMAVTEIPSTFLHADIEQDVHMLLEGMIAELIIKHDNTENIFGKVSITN